MRFHEILQTLGIEIGDTPDLELRGVNTLEQAQPTELAFLENKRFYPQLQITQAGALILPQEAAARKIAQERQIPHVCVPNPRLVFAKAMALFHPPQRLAAGIHPTAVLGKGVQVGAGVAIGAYTVIGDGVTIGNDVQIYPHVTIYDNVAIGDRTVIHSQCAIHSNTVIGSDCILHSGVVIGDEGFGFVPQPDGTWWKMPQVGQVVIEDGVEIGCHSCIDRAALGVTRIGRGTKIDNLVQIGHGCSIGENSLLAGQVGLAGGVKLGRNVVLAGQVGVTNHVHIGDQSVIAAQSGVAEDVPPKSELMGYPAFASKDFFRATVLFRRLPELYKIIKQLQAKL
ncbi:MAG: UDP-3-O-(3-hydroxymyristoyl)glucosamine N-acyltransferase [Pseudanabaenaceae cyanobacterium SKYGB_i_bin29]|nr:UDP-3-O-(3-hydroxymyristoyl)glucosamine N-acyltransferase [Pseudanabaenaceae cyanobacterium SKYG29]MDW8420571.1 UDP-3-O-(3-hydroxymyristoyl)glucosamine N-acyltransferase [Pseudanabaenaceae cyanobacterium SKYGB_i_bin29]